MDKFQAAVVDALGSPSYRDTGNDVITHCPVCGDEHEGDKLYIQKNQFVHCFVCDTASKGIIQFLTKFMGFSYADAKSYSKAYELGNSVTTNYEEDDNLFTELLSSMGDTSYNNNNNSPVAVKLPSNARPLVGSKITPGLKIAVEYIVNRGVTESQAVKFNIMYTDGDIVTTANGKKLSVPESIVFPAYDSEGHQIYWNTRSIPGKSLLKTINAPAINGVTYSTSNTVWNLNNMKVNSVVTVVESVFNALTLERSGIGAVATYGKGISEEQLNMIAAISPRVVIVYLDSDGIDKELKYAKKLSELGINTRYVDSPYGSMDANDLGYVKAREVVTKYSYKYNLANALITMNKHNIKI